MENYENNKKVQITLKEVMEELEKEGYLIKRKTIEGIKDIKTDKEKIEMEVNSETKVEVTLIKRRNGRSLFCTF